MLTPKNELQCIKRIYILIFALLLLNPLLNSFISTTTILRGAELLCYIGILYYYKMLKNKCLIRLCGYIKVMYILLFVITTLIILRGNWPSSPKDFMLHLLTTPKYLLPFIIIRLPNIKYFRELLKLFFIISLFVIPCWIFNYSNLVQIGTYKAEGIGEGLPYISAFLLGLSSYLSKKQRTINIIIWAIYFILMMLNARRNASFTLLLYAFIAFIFTSLISLKRNSIKTVIIYLFSILTLLVIFLNFETLSSGIFNNMSNRVGENTRSGVEKFFFADFSNSPISDWIFGRGMDGSYFQPVTNNETGQITYNRNVIETGYLYMILKGGVLYVIIVVLIMIKALKNGFFKKSMTLKYIATILFTYFVDLYTTNPVCIFSVRSIIFWFCISMCIQSNILFMQTNYSIKRYG